MNRRNGDEPADLLKRELLLELSGEGAGPARQRFGEGQRQRPSGIRAP